MDKKIIQIAAGIIILILTIAIIIFILNVNKLNARVKYDQMALQKMQDEMSRLKQDNEAISKEREKLQADTVSYLALNTKLQDEKDKMKKGIDDAQRAIEQKESELQRAKKGLEQAEKKMSASAEEKKTKLSKEKRIIEKKLALLAAKLKKERALYHYNLGVAYGQAKLYDEAIDAYNESFEFDADNPEAHYNIAVIYDSINNDSEKALSHYKKYLELKPKAEDKDEVEAAIGRLK